jgi:hypothetical protein
MVTAMSTKLIHQIEDDIPDDIDFSKAERGKFFRPNAQFNLPIYIDAALHAQLSSMAIDKDLDVSAFASDLLKKDIELIKSKK